MSDANSSGGKRETDRGIEKQRKLIRPEEEKGIAGKDKIEKNNKLVMRERERAKRGRITEGKVRIG